VNLLSIIHGMDGMKVRNIFYFLRRGVVSTSPNTQAGWPPLGGGRCVFIQYIYNHPPHPEAVLQSATWGRAMLWWQGPTYHGFRSIQVTYYMVCFTGLPSSLIHDHDCNIIQHSCKWLCHEVIYKQGIHINPLAQRVNCSWHKCDAEETNVHLSHWPTYEK